MEDSMKSIYELIFNVDLKSIFDEKKELL